MKEGGFVVVLFIIIILFLASSIYYQNKKRCIYGLWMALKKIVKERPNKKWVYFKIVYTTQ